MNPRKRIRARQAAPHDHDDGSDQSGMSGLHWMAAGLFLAAGVEAALGERRGDHRASDAIRWAPLIAAPIAGVAHAARAAFPGKTTRALSQVANGIAIGVGAAGLASSVYAAVTAGADEEAPTHWQHRVPSLAPLAFCAAGLLGIVLDDEEEDAEVELAELRRRARLYDRFVPPRKPKLDRIVVHV